MEQYTVTGMSCAACSARVEKAVSKVPGVTACSVSLLTNSMGVEGSAEPQAVIAAVEEAGYGAAVKGASAEAVEFAGEAQLDTAVQHLAVVDAVGTVAEAFGGYAHRVGQQVGSFLIIEIEAGIQTTAKG